MTERWTWQPAPGGFRVNDRKGVQICIVSEERLARLIAAAPALAAFADRTRRMLGDNATDIAFLLKQIPEYRMPDAPPNPKGGVLQ